MKRKEQKSDEVFSIFERLLPNLNHPLNKDYFPDGNRRGEEAEEHMRNGAREPARLERCFRGYRGSGVGSVRRRRRRHQLGGGKQNGRW